MQSLCSICAKPCVALGFCNAHYIAFRKYGDPLWRFNRKGLSFKERSVVDPTTECWIWTQASKRYPYGMWNAHGEKKAHRASWAMHNGPIPAGIQVLHTCDRPSCVNPGHLLLGTQVANMRDMKEKKRGRKSIGAANTNAKLNETQVRNIRADPRSNSDVAEEYGVGRETIRHIRNGKLWPHIK